MQPLCPRCGAPLDPSNTRPSHSGAVHPECVRPEDSAPPAPVDSFERAAPKYDCLPIRRSGLALEERPLRSIPGARYTSICERRAR
jgi:hypothetical protein